ncbi:hypothetical protein [Marinifilum sp. D714]|uniref:hypothetical protein n=1 Tax=Marinifilum sp. D714 TaxID=2937523 RepID=UPI0027C263DE|nr:hypothetical protein [Marinifilum sp. D714]MDQ2178162.1 hypothetical protein [Marinifilum sp. D714]
MTNSTQLHETFKSVLDINLNERLNIDTILITEWNISKDLLFTYHTLLKEAIRICKQQIEVIPKDVTNDLYKYCSSFLTQISMIKISSNGKSKYRISIGDTSKIIKWTDEILNNEFYYTISTIKLFETRVDPDLEFDKIFERKHKLLLEMEDNIKTIHKELQNKTKKHITSDYAQIFGQVWEKHRSYSVLWLLLGVFIAFVFVISFFYGIYDHFPTENLRTSGEFANYNIGNIITRVLIISIQIYIISFSFKQYTVNRHLQNLNRHRANAFESYKLFDAILDKKDTTNRNELMLQLAKAIYEQTSTGYLSEKGSNFNLSLTEITKMLGQNAPK